MIFSLWNDNRVEAPGDEACVVGNPRIIEVLLQLRVEGMIEEPAAEDDLAPDAAPDGVACDTCSTPRVSMNDSNTRDVNDSRPSKPKSVSDGPFGIVIFLSSFGVDAGVRLGVGFDLTFAEDEPAPPVAPTGSLTHPSRSPL